MTPETWAIDVAQEQWHVVCCLGELPCGNCQRRQDQCGNRLFEGGFGREIGLGVKVSGMIRRRKSMSRGSEAFLGREGGVGLLRIWVRGCEVVVRRWWFEGVR